MAGRLSISPGASRADPVDRRNQELADHQRGEESENRQPRQQRPRPLRGVAGQEPGRHEQDEEARLGEAAQLREDRALERPGHVLRREDAEDGRRDDRPEEDGRRQSEGEGAEEMDARTRD